MLKFNDKLLDELLKDYDYGNPNPDLIKEFRKKWTATIQDWKTALNKFHILFKDRFKF